MLAGGASDFIHGDRSNQDGGVGSTRTDESGDFGNSMLIADFVLAVAQRVLQSAAVQVSDTGKGHISRTKSDWTLFWSEQDQTAI